MKQDLDVKTTVLKPDDSIEGIKRDVKNFVLINLVLVSIIGVLMIITKFLGNESSLDGFPTIMMLLPALSVIHIKTKINGEEVSPNVMKFYDMYKWMTGITFIFITVSALTGFKNINFFLGILLMLVGIIVLFSINGNKDQFGKINMLMFKNTKALILILLYFIATKIGFLIFGNAYEGQPLLSMADIAKLGYFAIYFVLSLIFSWLLFFGEEFGWRGYLQPRMQKLYGNRMGVILVGIIWGLWHLPLCTMFYAPDTPIECIVNHVGFCIATGIFIGYAYMKTENIWVPIMIHTANNSFAGAFSEISDNVLDFKSIFISLALCFALYGIFIFAKIFNKNRSEISIDI